MLIDIYIKFPEDSLSGFSSYRADTVEARFGDGQSSKGNNSKRINAIVMVLTICTFSKAD